MNPPRHLVVLLRTFALSLLLPGLASAVEIPAKIAYVEGAVLIKRQTGQMEPAEAGTGLFRGDTVITGTGRAQLNLAASGVLRLSANTRINISQSVDGVTARATTGSELDRLRAEEVFEVRTPVNVMGIQNGGRLFNGWVEKGTPRTNDELQKQFVTRGITSHWPVLPPDASRPVIPDPCTIAMTEWPTKDPKLKSTISLRINNGVVAGDLHTEFPKTAGQKVMNFTAKFEGTIVGNQIKGTWKWTMHAEYEFGTFTENNHYEMIYDRTGSHTCSYELRLDGTTVRTLGMNSWTARWSYRNASPGLNLQPGENAGTDESRSDPLTGRWGFGSAARKTEATR